MPWSARDRWVLRVHLLTCCRHGQAHAILVADEPNAIAVPLSEECRTCNQLEEDMRTTRSEDVRQAESEQASHAKNPVP